MHERVHPRNCRRRTDLAAGRRGRSRRTPSERKRHPQRPRLRGRVRGAGRRAGARRRPPGALAVKRYVILAEGAFDEEAKTATGVMRYAESPTVAVIDSTRAGSVAGDHVPGMRSDVPVVATLADALPFEPTTLLVGVAPAGGKLPAAYRRAILDALHHGLDVESGLHDFVGDDPEF